MLKNTLMLISIVFVQLGFAQQVIQGLDLETNQPMWPSQEDYLMAKDISSINVKEKPRLRDVFFSSMYQEKKYPSIYRAFQKSNKIKF
ncbi:hypothetical protein MRY82_06335 [bacterium]|nr:hypothetical protein [bacterium]